MGGLKRRSWVSERIHVHAAELPSLQTVIATSGQTMAQKVQPVQVSFSQIRATRIPRLSTSSFSVISPLGQAQMQSPHPLQRAESMVICPLDLLLFIENSL
jgi:hypothetical protein